MDVGEYQSHMWKRIKVSLSASFCNHSKLLNSYISDFMSSKRLPLKANPFEEILLGVARFWPPAQLYIIISECVLNMNILLLRNYYDQRLCIIYFVHTMADTVIITRIYRPVYSVPRHEANLVYILIFVFHVLHFQNNIKKLNINY